MKNKYLISEYKNKRFCAIYEDDIPVEFIFIENSDYTVGSIYIGHVESIIKNLNAAFVDLGNGVKGYLPLKTPDSVKAGTDITVQIEKEAIKSKEIRLTEDISIGGKFLAISKGRPGIGISRKISSEEVRSRLKRAFEEFIENDPDLNKFFAGKEHGMVVRTAAAEADFEEIKTELVSIVDVFRKTVDFAENRTCHSCLYKPLAEYLLRIRDSKSEIERIVTDLPDIYDECRSVFADSKEIIDALALYEDEMLPLIKLYSIETVFEEALHKKVWMKSGGFLVIEPTEALTVIDVNSGKNIKGKNKQKLIFETNKEAVYETARQLRLRNISGIIIIDFINMADENYKVEIISEIKRVLKKDCVQTRFIDFTPLGLAEVTREKIHRPLWENLRI
ncbi:MAG: ribonuclease E/G [Lachnospiraceae bacterium]|nr:ribonuclease E/G [Lachnospiraceae bacterium]